MSTLSETGAAGSAPGVGAGAASGRGSALTWLGFMPACLARSSTNLA